MKRFIKYAKPLMLGALALLAACGPEMSSVETANVPAVNGATLSPLTDESGSSRAYVGTEVSVEGYNLEFVTRAEFDELEAEITDKSFKSLKFRVPALQFPQNDNPYYTKLNIYGPDGLIFTTSYYVTIPVTDALVSGYAPAEGTIGTEVTISGRNLQQVTRVHFGSAVIEAADFTAVAEDGASITFAVPAGEYAAGDSEIEISAEWGTQSIDVTGEEPFVMHTPQFDTLEQAEGENSKIGDEVTITGKNLYLVTAVLWGEKELLIVEPESKSEADSDSDSDSETEAEAETITVRFPSSLADDGSVVSKDITAVWGTPEQTTLVAEAWRVDLTPIGPAAPVVSSMTAQDGGADNKFYLGKVVTVKGENLATVEGFLVDGVEAELSGEPSDLEAKFIVPAGVDFDTATEVEIKAVYNDGEQVDAGKAMVYPFYFYPDVTIGAQGESNRGRVFFLPEQGRVLSTDEFNDGIDPYIGSKTQSAANTLDKTVITSADMYHEVPAYIFVTNSGSNVFSFISPSNSASQITNHRTSDGTKLASGYGTPVIGYRNIEFDGASAAETAAAAKARNGELTSVSDLMPKLVSSGAPQFDNVGTANNRFKNGQVIAVQHMSYQAGKFSGMSLSDVYAAGLLVVKQMEGFDGATGSNDATVTFDFYWTKPLIEE